MDDGKQVPVSQMDPTELLRLVAENNALLRELLQSSKDMNDKLRKIMLNTN